VSSDVALESNSSPYLSGLGLGLGLGFGLGLSLRGLDYINESIALE